jgi:hypothetical protein
MIKTHLRHYALGVLLAVGCGYAAASGSKAEQYASYVIEGKNDAQHHLHQQAAIMWQAAAPQLTTLAKSEQAQWWLAQADLLQFEHRFDAALLALDKVLALSALQQSAYLMQARIALTRHNLPLATQACQALAAYAQFDVVATCLLEVKGRAGELTSSYIALQRLQARYTDSHIRANTGTSSALALWRYQILAEQAQLLKRYDEALIWLDYANYATNPVVMQRQILDVLLVTERADDIIRLAGTCPIVDALPADSMLVRIAHAEAKLGMQHCWRNVAAQRMHLRELRADVLHTSDLAYYFIYLQPNATKALHWARQNIAVAQEPFDQQLLAAAKEIAP